MTDITVPSPGESILTVTLAAWLVEDGDYVEKDQEVAEIDSDKATLTISTPEAGKIKIQVQAGEEVAVGSVVATIAAVTIGEGKKKDKAAKKTGREETVIGAGAKVPEPAETESEQNGDLHFTPLAKAYMDAEGISEGEVSRKVQQKLKKADIQSLKEEKARDDQGEFPDTIAFQEGRNARREKMSPLRIKLSQRLVGVKNETAMLTTINEVDMSEVMKIRSIYGESFEEKYGVKLGLMAFFTRAATISLMEFPGVNAFIEQDEIVYHDYVDVSIAVSTPKGLVVPVIRDAHRLSLAGTEKEIRRLAEKAKHNKLTLEEMSGGTFTITNGGVFGSMLSTPIINPPQSAILGMHNIVERPVAVSGKVEVRPVMYLALSYDHRIIDGKESVGFLVRVKELIENPLLMVTRGNPYYNLLGI